MSSNPHNLHLRSYDHLHYCMDTDNLIQVDTHQRQKTAENANKCCILYLLFTLFLNKE